jgi:two-component system CheB/CheR fusion protein
MHGDDSPARARAHRLEQELARSEAERRSIDERLRLIVENTPAAVAILDRDMRYVVVSRRWMQDYELGERNIIGLKHYDVFPDIPQLWRDVHRRCMAGEVIRGQEESFRRPDGRVEWLCSELDPWWDANGNIGGIAIFSEVITGRKRADQALKRAHLDFEAKVTERTAALEAARNEAIEGSAQISRFLTAASHNLRQPLQAIAALLHVLSKRSGGSQNRAIIEKIDDSMQQMVDMIDALLDIGQIESGQSRPEISDVPIAAILNVKVAEFASLAAAKGISLRYVPSSAIVQSDRYLLERVIGHLLSITVKFTRRGGILLGCRRRQGAIAVEIYVSGNGFNEEQRQLSPGEHLDFFGLADSGLGLGLFFVQRICALLGHPIDLRTRSGGGSVFSIKLPVLAGSAPAHVAFQEPSAGIAVSVPTIMVIEDDPALLGDLAMMVDSEGYRVVSMRRGEDAVAAISQAHRPWPSVIVTDYNLGSGMTGVEAVKAIREVVGREVPALILSGDKSPATMAVIEEGGSRYLGKPVKAQVLLDILESMIVEGVPGWEKREPAHAPSIAVVPPQPRLKMEYDVAIVDEDISVGEALSLALEQEGYDVVLYATGEAYEENAAQIKARCIVLDLDLPDDDGIALISRFKTEQPDVPIICMTARGELSKAVKAMQAGAADVLEKPISGPQIALSIVHAIARLPDRGMALERPKVEADLAKLTTRERQVLDGVLSGKPNKVIANELGISQRTTEHHRASLMAKLGVKSLAALVRLVSADV